MSSLTKRGKRKKREESKKRERDREGKEGVGGERPLVSPFIFCCVLTNVLAAPDEGPCEDPNDAL